LFGQPHLSELARQEANVAPRNSLSAHIRVAARVNERSDDAANIGRICCTCACRLLESFHTKGSCEGVWLRLAATNPCSNNELYLARAIARREHAGCRRSWSS